MKLYLAPGACSLSPHIILREAGLAFSIERVDLRTKTTAGGGDYHRVNPKGYVPALALKDGSVLTEVPAVLQFVADLVPEKQLVPRAGSIERYRAMEWLNFISSELHKSFGPLFNRAAGVEARGAASAGLARRLAYVAQALEGRKFLVGERFTVADAYLFTVLTWSGFVSFDLSPWPALLEYHASIGARPAVKEAMRAEGISTE
ncbi:MAG: glutathione transferase GstA [Telluria sp.]